MKTELFSVWGIKYSDALLLIEEVAEYGIPANITAGGIAIYPIGTIQVNKMNLVCRKYGTIASRGYTPHEENVLFHKK